MAAWLKYKFKQNVWCFNTRCAQLIGFSDRVDFAIITWLFQFILCTLFVNRMFWTVKTWNYLTRLKKTTCDNSYAQSPNFMTTFWDHEPLECFFFFSFLAVAFLNVFWRMLKCCTCKDFRFFSLYEMVCSTKNNLLQ